MGRLQSGYILYLYIDFSAEGLIIYLVESLNVLLVFSFVAIGNNVNVTIWRWSALLPLCFSFNL